MKNRPSRRDFIKVSAAGVLGTFVLSPLSCRSHVVPAAAPRAVDPKTLCIGLQLYTLRDAMVTDVTGSLKKVAAAGYSFVELAGYANRKFYGYEPAQFKRLVDDLGMQIISSHTQVEARGITIENAKRMAADHARLGVKYCIQPWVVEQERGSLESYRRMAAEWNQVGRVLRDCGIQFGYHNHNFEFETVEGKVPYYDILLAELDPTLVTMELDLFWAMKAGQDPIRMFNAYPGRFQLFHLKDMYTAGQRFFVPSSQDFAPVGEGVTNFKQILAAKDVAGLKYMIVEQDQTSDGDPFAAIKTSIDNLTNEILL